MMAAPHVYAAISAVAGELAATGIAKRCVNGDDRYRFRGIDDVLAALSPLLVRHRLCILPRVLSRSVTERSDTAGRALFAVTLHVSYAFVSAEDGSEHVVETFGEAVDGNDKATNKAMSAAYKYAMIQSFCIPAHGMPDADSATLSMESSSAALEPVQGWQQWSEDILDIVRACETGEAIDRLQTSNRNLLKAIARAEPELYAYIGHGIGERRQELAMPTKRVAGDDAKDTHKRLPRQRTPSLKSQVGSAEPPLSPDVEEGKLGKSAFRKGHRRESRKPAEYPADAGRDRKYVSDSSESHKFRVAGVDDA